ncbi:MAG: beta-galactosidase [Pseudomonadota bacterium]
MKRALGVCYYPEHWPEAIWAEDARRMADIGITWVRICEFAWSRLEPTPGDLRFDWLDRAIETLAEAGLKVVLGTPTATAPRWMLDRHPDMLAVDAEGRPRKFGSRRHYCFSHSGYREECARIVTLLADRYGGDERVAAWQTDNEYDCHDTTLSYSDAAANAFRSWLSQKYVQIEGLNTAWGNVFWSMEYCSFDEIDLPNLTVTEPNPAHQLDFARFSSDQVVSFNRVQTDIIRARSEAPITHNFMGGVTAFDHFEVGDDLEIASWDSYPLGFLEDRVRADEAHKKRHMRTGDPDFQAFHHDLYRAIGNSRWWVMEQQPGPVNWAPYNPAPAPGMARLWAWEAFAHGAEAVCYFRWRQAPFAQEQMHAGLLRPDSSETPTVAEARAVAEELAAAPDVEASASEVAIVFDYESAWAWRAQPQGADFDYHALVFDWYRGLRQLGASVDFVAPDTADLSAYKLVLAPGLMRLKPELGIATAKHLALGPRAASKTADMVIPPGLPPDVDGLDVTVDWVESLRPDAPTPLKGGGAFTGWREFLSGGAEVIEAAADGHPAVMRQGDLTYIGGWLDGDARVRVFSELMTFAGLTPQPMPGALRIRDTADARYLINYGPDPEIYGDITVPPADFTRLSR